VDYIVIGCDGIYEVKSNQEIIDMVTTRAAKKSLKETAEDILDGLLAPTTQSSDCSISDEFGLDNMTLLIVKMKN
jgi:serine/threonine protein phosphatase PrpC